MSKFVNSAAVASTSFLLYSSYIDPYYPITLIASTSPTYAAIRGVLAILMLGLLVTRPPRKIYFRAVLGTVSAALLAGTLLLTYQNSLQILDALTFLLTGICFGIAALEPNREGYRFNTKSELQKARTFTATA